MGGSPSIRAPAPRPLARALAGGLRLVTEGYSGEQALPPTPGGGDLGVTKAYVIYGVFCAWC